MSEIKNDQTTTTTPRLKPEGPWKIAWNRFKKNKVALVGGTGFLLIVLGVIVIPMIFSFNLWRTMELDAGTAISSTVLDSLDEKGVEIDEEFEETFFNRFDEVVRQSHFEDFIEQNELDDLYTQEDINQLFAGEAVGTGRIIRETIFVNLRAHGFELENSDQPPSRENWLGTDRQGRDVMFRLFYGGRISLIVGLLSATLTVSLGTVVGGVSGYYGGKLDAFLMRFAEIVQSIPLLPMMMSISAAMRWVPSERTLLVVVFVVGILSWPGLARVVRGQILSLREQEFMQATEILGISDVSRIFRHLLPNVLAYIIVSATLGMGGAILLEAGLSFLGLGVQPPMPSWGNMIYLANNSTVFREYLWMWIPPGVMIMLTVVSVNLLGEGLRDALDPKEIR